MYYPFETQVSPLVNIRRERVLPMTGNVLVHTGDRVEPMQVVARTDLPGEFRVLNLARALGIKEAQVKKYLRIKAGEDVRQGQLIAKRGGRLAKSPIDGKLITSGGGRVLIEAPSVPFELRAYIYGSVTNVLEGRGVVIETTGAVIQGAWGAGGENFGVLKRLVKSPDKPLRARDIDPSCHGTIIIGGSGLNDAVFERAEELQVRGIVTGGLPPDLIAYANRLPFPVIATEGIGTVPMSDPIFQLLTTNDGREASISGLNRPRWGVMRPEIIIPLPAESVPSTHGQPGTPLTIGARVRILRAPHAGKVGTVVALSEYARRIETGAKVHGAEVKLGDGPPAFIPMPNLEILR